MGESARLLRIWLDGGLSRKVMRMSSSKQLIANRANAKKSTGPKTDAGKARSRMNAYKHGLTAEKVVAACEDPAAFNALRTGLWEQYDPGPGVESGLVDRLASLSWRLNRIPIMETTFFRSEIAFNYAENKYLPQLSRYESSLLAGFNRTLQQLLVLQERRFTKEEAASTVDVLPEARKNDAA